MARQKARSENAKKGRYFQSYPRAWQNVFDAETRPSPVSPVMTRRGPRGAPVKTKVSEEELNLSSQIETESAAVEKK